MQCDRVRALLVLVVVSLAVAGAECLAFGASQIGGAIVGPRSRGGNRRADMPAPREWKERDTAQEGPLPKPKEWIGPRQDKEDQLKELSFRKRRRLEFEAQVRALVAIQGDTPGK